MHLLDVVLPVAALIVAVAVLRTARRRRGLRLPMRVSGRMLASSAAGGLLILLAATVTQGLLSPWRWQLIPAVVGVVILAPVLVARAAARPVLLARTAAVAAIVGAGVSLLLSWALPLRVLPVPDGPHAVGTTTIVVVDPSRAERYGPEPGGPRELVVQLWYPAAPDAPRAPAPLVPQAAAFIDLGASELGLPRFALGHLAAMRGNASSDVQALDVASPVALLSHGWTGFRTIQTDLAEQLASEGWIVAAADHRFGALVTTFPDGRADVFDPEALPEFGTIPDDEFARRSRALLATFADDLALVLDALARQPPDVLAGRIDAGRVAMLGHSTGGGAAFQACAAETRCVAAVGFDPWVVPVDPGVLRSGIDRPLLSLRTEDWMARPNEQVLRDLHAIQRAGRRPEALVRIDGALHRDFTLIGALSPVARVLGFAGETSDTDTRRATIVWTSRFLDHHVLGVGPDPLVEPPALPVGILEDRQ